MKNILNDSVLVLTNLYQAGNVTTVQEALGKMASDTYTALVFQDGSFYPVKWEDWIKLTVEPDEEAIRSQYLTIKVPKVVMGVNFKKVPKVKPKLTTTNVGKRDGFICQYCGQYVPKGNKDHVKPRAQGGKTTWKNLVWSCVAHNEMKGNRSPEEAGLKLLRAPREPVMTPKTGFISSRKDKPEWDHFLIQK